MSKAKKPASVPKKASPKRPGQKTQSTKVQKTEPASSQRRVKTSKRNLPGAFRLFGRSLQVLQQHWQLFIWIVIIYVVLDLVLVRGLSGGLNLSSIKSSIVHTSSSSASLSTGFTLFVYLLGNAGSSNSSSANAGVYQTMLLIIVSLATIWALRQVYNNNAIRVRDSFYKGVYPLVPFILVLLVIGLQLLPLLIGGTLYSIVISSGIAVGLLQELLWALLFLGFALISLYLLSSSLFALYIVTLPEMTPFKALRSARDLVRHRRWLVLRKILFLPLILLILAAVILVPLLVIVTPIASWIFLLLSLASLVVVHSYGYALYRELLNE